MTDLATMPDVQEKPSAWRRFWQAFAPHYFRFDNAIIEEGGTLLNTLSKIIPGSMGALLIALTAYQALLALDAANSQAFALWCIGLIAALYVTLSSVTNDDAMLMCFGGFLIMPSIPIGLALAAASAPSSMIVAVSIAFIFVAILAAGAFDGINWLYKAVGFALRTDRVQMAFMRWSLGAERMRLLRTGFEMTVEGEDGLEIYTIKGVLPSGEVFEYSGLSKTDCYSEAAFKMNAPLLRQTAYIVLNFNLRFLIVAILSIFFLLLYLQLSSLLITLLFRVL